MSPKPQPQPELVGEPDAWWGPDGIDAMMWADGIPFEWEGGGV